MKKLLTLGVAALAAGAAAVPAAHAWIDPAGPGVANGHNITVFHNIDFVAVFGNPGNLTVDVIRGTETVGRAAGPAVVGAEGLALEVNHGPGGAPAPGDCWIGYTPDVLPGDLIRVTNNETVPPSVDEVYVDDIGFNGPPFMETVPVPTTNPITGVETVTQEETGNIHVQGFARYSDGLGTPIPIEALDSAEFRGTNFPQFRGVPDEVIRTPGTTDGFTSIYEPPYDLERNRDGLDEDERRAELLTEGHAAGFGHTAVLPLESMLVDGTADPATTAGPALGCEGEERNSILGADDEAVNIGSGDLVVNGGRSDPAVTVGLTVSDSDAGTQDVAIPVTNLAGGAWEVTVPRASLDTLSDGELTVSAAFSSGGNGNELELLKDVVAPAVTADPAPGTYSAARAVALRSGPGEPIRYSTNGGAPTTTYAGNRILLEASKTTTIRTLATDAAGNTAEQSFAYTIAAPPTPRAPAPAPAPVAAVVKAIVAPVAAPAPAPAPVTPAAFDLSSLNVSRSSYSLARSVRVRSVRRNGMRVRYTAPAGAQRMQFIVHRRGAPGRTLLRRTVRVLPGRRSVRLKWRGLRPGRYVLEIRALKDGQAGRKSKRTFRITP